MCIYSTAEFHKSSLKKENRNNYTEILLLLLYNCSGLYLVRIIVPPKKKAIN